MATKQLKDMTVGQRRQRIAELVKAHNTAAIPDKYLPANLKAKRAQAQKLKQPLVGKDLAYPGATTYGEFLKARKAAANQKFSPEQLGIEEEARTSEAPLQQQQRDIPGYYDDYLKQLAGIQQQVTSQYGQLAAQAQQLGTTEAAGGSGSPEAQAAASARENLARASSGALLGNQGQAAQKFGELAAAGLARKMQRREQIGQQIADVEGKKGRAIADLQRRKGEFYDTYTTDAKQKEFENALAAQTLGVKQQTAEADARDKAVKRSDARNKPTTSGAFAGLSAKEIAALTPQQRDARVAKYNRMLHPKPKGDGSDVVTSGAFAGLTKDQIRAMSPQAKQTKLDDYNKIIHPGKGKGKGKGSSSDGGFDWRTPAQSSTFMDHLSKDLARAKPSHKKGVGRNALATAMTREGREGLTTSVALDLLYDGAISRRNVRRLHDAGIKVQDVINAFGGTTQVARQNSDVARGNPNIPSGKI